MALSDSQKLDLLVASIADLKASQASLQAGQAKLEAGQAHLETLIKRVSSLETSVDILKNTVHSLQLQVNTLKVRDNRREQEGRGLNLRLNNFPGSNSETDLKTKVYEVLKPILAVAKEKEAIPTLPQLASTIDRCFRVGRFADGVGKPPPPIVIVFKTAAIRMAVLLHKKGNIPTLPDVPKKLALSEDLTAPTHKKMKEFLGDDRVAKVWTRDGVIWYVLKGDKMPARFVKSVFEEIDDIIS